MSEKSVEILSEITTYMKYAKYIPEKKRRETWEELCDRNRDMHIKKFPKLKREITEVYDNYVKTKKVLPSMRSLQFGGKPIEVSPNRIFNCAYLPVDHPDAFSETMFLLLGGTGCGYSVQRHHVKNLPPVVGPLKKKKRFLVGDSIEGWADAVKVIVESYFYGKATPVFDFSDIRPKGAALVTSGGKAPGPQPLKDCVHNIKKVFDTVLEERGRGTQLKPIEVHDIQCYIADAVLAGGIRRAALISLFSMDDNEMLTSKHGSWWETAPHRGRANNSAVILRHKVLKSDFDSLWDKVVSSGSGEPGVYLSNDKDWGTNPCCFTGNMKLLTNEGYKHFSELEGLEFHAINKNGQVVPSTVWSNGVKDIVEVKTASGDVIRCTPDHRFLTSDGEETVAANLKGKRLTKFYSKPSIFNNEFVRLGFIQGDGVTGRLTSNAHLGCEINIGNNDMDIHDLFGIEKQDGKRTYYVRGYNEKLTDIGVSPLDLPNRTMPTDYSNMSPFDKRSFLRGMYSANGSVIKGHRVAYKTTCKDLANQLVQALSEFEISSYVTTNKAKKVKFSNGEYECRESYDVNISTLDSVIKFAEKIGFVHGYKTEALDDLILTKSPYVVSVKSAGEEEVFDFTLDDDTHWGIVEGVVAHNCEIALRPYQFCNLCELNASDVDSQQELNERAKAAAFIGTLQASYTDFHYLRDVWKETTEKDALIGVGMTGIGSGKVLEFDLSEAANEVKNENARVANLLGINLAARTTTVKPSGTSSMVLGTSSGIHAWHNDYYVRRIRVGKDESIYSYLHNNHPELVEDEYFRPDQQAVIEIPQKAPKDSILRHESPIDLLNRVGRFNSEWVRAGHRGGQNAHNVSCTISVKDDEWELVGEWMWKNRNNFNGISVLPYDGGTYIQAPFEDISKERYEMMEATLSSIDLTQVIEEDDNTDLSGEIACGAGGCEIV